MTIAETTHKIRGKIEDRQTRIEAVVRGIGKGRLGRVLRMARKPETEEYVKSLWIVGMGMLLIGLIGFIIWYTMTFLPPYLQAHWPK